jgi:putative nucleotidyltransferase with HDIG domain
MVFPDDDIGKLEIGKKRMAPRPTRGEAVQDLQDQFVALLKSLSETIDARNSHTRGHSKNVARYALAVARQMKWAPDRRHRLEIAALLHDVGKLGVEAFILAKPASLDEVEMAAIRYHPLLGVRILESVRQLADIIPFIRHHHERFDGNGYPDRLKGEDIPLEARILSVADAYEAITSNRPYRRARSPQEALQEIRKGIGTQFDPRVVEAFESAFANGQLEPLSDNQDS